MAINTLQSYERDVLQFEKYLDANNLNYAKIDVEDTKKYLKHLQEVGKKTSSISRGLASIRCFYQYELKNKRIFRILKRRKENVFKYITII